MAAAACAFPKMTGGLGWSRTWHGSRPSALRLASGRTHPGFGLDLGRRSDGARSLFQTAAARSRQQRRPPGGLMRRAPLPQGGPSSSSSSAPSASQTLSSIISQRKVPLLGAAVAAGILGFLVMPLMLEYMLNRCDPVDARTAESVDLDAVPPGLPSVGARAFDTSLEVPERMMGIMKMRKKLALDASGDVLEVAVGTGRNVAYYTWDRDAFDPYAKRLAPIMPDFTDVPTVRSFTGIDLSADALGITRSRLRLDVPLARPHIPKRADPIPTPPDEPDGRPGEAEVLNVMDGRLRLFRADATRGLPPASTSPSGKYDTIIQTFGLCSVSDPVVLLANMAAVLKPDTGRIVLLEHGRGGSSLVDKLLDRYAKRHFCRFGCWWNRDMQTILDKAQEAVPGLEIVSVSRPGFFQFGTLWWIELRLKNVKK